jgi:histidyl-tRNA synthetase
MRDFLPEDIRRRQHVIAMIAAVYERYGFEPIETPAVENLETLLGKYGEEGNQLIYKILKRGEGEATGLADLALRYDLTVPLARVIAHHQSKLPRLFKRYQIQPVWRADRPARGRFREFYQCDVDALGSTSPVVEAELCAAVSDALVALGFQDFEIRLNHRQLLTDVLLAAGVPADLHGTALVALDKMDKIQWVGVSAELMERGVAAAAVKSLFDVFGGRQAPEGTTESVPPPGSSPTTGDPVAVLEHLSAWISTATRAASGGVAESPAFTNLRAIMELAATTSAAGRVRFDPTLARGLSYYTGAIMEVAVPDLRGSLGGGGRYDNLVGMFLGQQVPACGFSLGLERILVVMGERNMFPPSLQTTPADVMVAALDAGSQSHALRVAGELRASGLRVLVYPDAEKLGKQIKYADSRGIPCVAILGTDEIAAGTVTVKHLATQAQAIHPQAAAGAAIREALRHRG